MTHSTADLCLDRPADQAAQLSESSRLILQAYVAAAAPFSKQAWARLPPSARITALYREIGRLDDAEATGWRSWHDLIADPPH